MQFGFVPGRRTTDAICVLTQLQEEFAAEKKDFYFAFAHLEDPSHQVPRYVVSWALRELGVDEWLVRSIYLIYRNAGSRGGTPSSSSNDFLVYGGLYQDSEESLRLCNIVSDTMSREIRLDCQEKLLYAGTFELI